MSDTILIVDDDVRLARAVQSRLRAAGYTSTHADCGRAAIQAAEETQPYVIILDIRLPDMTGFDVCERLRMNPSLRGVPIIFLSANSSSADRRHAMSSGGTEFLGKPCPPDMLLATIRRVCVNTSPAAALADFQKTNQSSQSTLKQETPA